MQERGDQTCSAVILAGGLNSRMGGRNKALLRIGGKTILDRLLGTLRDLFTEILLVTRNPGQYQDLTGVRVVQDIYEKRSSLTGLHAGLVSCRAEYAFIVPCDAPFLQPGVIRALVREIDARADVIVSTFDTHFEPLCAIYSKRCLPYIEAQLENDDFKIINFFDKVNVKKIPAEQLRPADPTMRSFYNVNTPEAYQASQDLAD